MAEIKTVDSHQSAVGRKRLKDKDVLGEAE
jgi:hypothetical protein